MNASSQITNSIVLLPSVQLLKGGNSILAKTVNLFGHDMIGFNEEEEEEMFIRTIYKQLQILNHTSIRMQRCEK